MAQEEMVKVCIPDGDAHFNLSIHKSTADKMSEIMKQEPGKWKLSLELLEEADRRLEAEKANQTEQNPEI